MLPQFFTLKNGLRVIFIDTKAFPTMTTILLFATGSRYENKVNNGIAHFLEHMPFKGSKKYPSFFAISSLLEGLGAMHNAYTSKDHTAFWVKAPTEHFTKVIDVLSDMILNPILKAEEIEREKGVIVEEINMHEDSPQRKVSDLFENLLYQDNPLGYDTIGTKETVTKFTRKTFLDYMGRFYNPKNAVLVVTGGLDLEQKAQYRFFRSTGRARPDVTSGLRTSQNRSKKVSLLYEDYIQTIEEKFSHWNNVGNPDLRSLQKVIENQKKPQTLIHYKKTEQTHFSLGFRTFSFFDKRKYILSVLATILGGGASSRLFIEVRERRGLCYYISTGRELYADVGYMVTQAGVTNDLGKIKEAIDVIMEEHNKIAKGQVKDEEIKRAKEIIKGRILLSMEDSSNVASWYGTKLILEKKIETVEEVIKKIESVTKDEIVFLAKNICKPEKLNLALIGPFQNDPFASALSAF